MEDLLKQWPAVTKRAGKACLNCRARKVKCNVEEHGVPCTNCLTDDVVCRVQKSRRGRRPTKDGTKKPSPTAEKRHVPSSPMADIGTDRLTKSAALKRLPVTHTTGWLSQYSLKDDSAAAELDKPVSHNISVHLKSYLDHKDEPVTDRFDTGELHRELTYAPLIDRDAVHYTTSSGPISRDNTVEIDHATPSTKSMDTGYEPLPDCVKPIAQHLTMDDIHYLRIKGALDIPSIELRKALIQSYVQYFHPLMPLLDLPTLMNCANECPTNTTPKMSILLLQAVMFAGVTFVDSEQIKRAGFICRRTARRVFYDRARLLYDLDAEHDRLTIIQAVTLLTFWSETPGDNKGGWHWMGVAVSLALTLDLHRQPQHTTPDRGSRLRKRIWWCCYMRDRLLALFMCRMRRINDSDFNTPMLALGDFELDDFPGEDPRNSVLNRDCQVRLAEICIQMAQLCTHIETVMDLHFSLLPPDHRSGLTRDPRGETSTMLFPRHRPYKADLVRICDRNLQTWLDKRTPAAIYQRPRTEDLNEPCKSITSSQAFLHIIFYGIVSALHRPQINSGHMAKQNPSQLDEHQRLSMTRTEEASLEVARINLDLLELGLVGYVFPPTITIQMPVAITQLRRLRTHNPEQITKALEALYSCLAVLEILKKLYVGADCVMAFVVEVMRKAGVMPAFNVDSKIQMIRFGDYEYRPGCGHGHSDTMHDTVLCDASETNTQDQDQAQKQSFSRPAVEPELDHSSGLDNLGWHSKEGVEEDPFAHWTDSGDMFLPENLDWEAAFGVFMDLDQHNTSVAEWPV
ncbi:Cutinase transcription factor 1 beta [Exophiala dermatitidis]